MTPLSERVPLMNDADLKILRANAERLVAHGSATQMTAAAELIPVIDDERARRDALPVAKAAPRKAAVRKKKELPATGHQTALPG